MTVKSRREIQVKTVEYTHKQNYNKTLVVGHALSDQKAVKELLNAGGMSAAKPLQQHSIEATEISQILSQTYNPTGVSKEQLSVDKVWDGLALDLLMSNRDKTWWGWSDSEALPYLNYWKSIDSKLGFIFVYDTPESFMKQILLQSETLSSNSIAKAVDEWCAYNEALLKFYYRNMECSLLVNTQQVKLRTTEYLQQVSKQIGLKSTELDDNAIVTLQETFQNDVNDPLFSYLVDDILKGHPNITNIFEELQSVANLPFNVLNETQHTPLNALLALQNDKAQYDRLQEKISFVRKTNEAYQNQIASLESKQKELAELKKSKSSENEELLTQLMSVQEELEKYYLASQKSTNELASLEKTLKKKQKENESLAKGSASVKQSKVQELESVKKAIAQKAIENEELLTQLMSVQEELEKHYLVSQKNTKELASLKKTFKENEQLKAELNSFQKKQKELAELKKSKSSENEELLTQLMSVQEELEKYYLQNRRLKKKQQAVKRYYGAAQRVKKQLSYRLGAKMIEKSKSIWGILALPFSLRAVYLEYKKDMQERAGKKLPPIETYTDAYEVPRIKKHLSYRLGEALIASTRTPFGIFTLPAKLSKAHREFKEERNNA